MTLLVKACAFTVEQFVLPVQVKIEDDAKSIPMRYAKMHRAMQKYVWPLCLNHDTLSPSPLSKEPPM